MCLWDLGIRIARSRATLSVPNSGERLLPSSASMALLSPLDDAQVHDRSV